jgi:16S rRNA (uracil1498-N3)-methyltransferase
MQHFFIDQDISGEHAVIVDEEILHQMKHVLRFEVGDTCVLLDGKGGHASGTIETMDKKAIILKLIDFEKFEKPARKIALYVAIPKKPATFEIILQKATELGVTDIIPIITDHCQIREIRNEKRLLYIIKEATEQCERLFLPKFHPILKFEKFIESPPDGVILTGDARMHDIKLGEMKIDSGKNISLVIGPEGGLTDKELADIHRIGGKIFVLGDTVLRMETAVIAALSVVLFGK